MIVTLQARRSAWVVPVLLSIASLSLVVATVAAILSAKSWGAVLVAAVFAALICWTALSELLRIEVRDGRLMVRGIWRSNMLEASRVALGVRLRSGSRSARFTVFISDGRGRADVADFGSEAASRRAVERLRSALLEPTHVPAASAVREVEAVEREWQAQLAQTMQVVNAYYQSPTWRRAKYAVIAVLVLYVVGMALFQLLYAPA
jgi:hypothetical protein